MKDGYSFHANYDSLMSLLWFKELRVTRSFTRSGIDYKATNVMQPWAEKILRVYGCYLLVHLDRWVVLDKSWLPLMKIPAVQEEIKAELLKWMISGEDSLPIWSNQPMLWTWLLNSNTVSSNHVVKEEEVKRGNEQKVKSMNKEAAFLNNGSWSHYQDFGLHADGEALLRSSRVTDQPNEVSWKPPRRRPLFEPATEVERKQLLELILPLSSSLTSENVGTYRRPSP